jgi:hypothetical protein
MLKQYVYYILQETADATILEAFSEILLQQVAIHSFSYQDNTFFPNIRLYE